MFTLRWTKEALQTYQRLKADAEESLHNRNRDVRRKSSKAEGLFKQICKTIDQLAKNPRHPSLNTHEYQSLPHPWDDKQKVWEAYAQNKTPGAYRVFWCYGPQRREITLIAVTPHP